MAELEPPRPSPALPPLPSETPSGVHRVVKLKHDVAILKGANLGLIGIVVSAIGIAFGGWRAMAADAKDAGISAAQDVKREADATQRELERHEAEEESRHRRQEASQDRLEAKLDVMLSRFQIPNPAPAPTKDAGR